MDELIERSGAQINVFLNDMKKKVSKDIRATRERHIRAVQETGEESKKEFDATAVRLGSEFRGVLGRFESDFADFAAGIEPMLQQRLRALIDRDLEFLLRKEVQDFVQRGPLRSDGLTNRQRARMHGMSLRAVKRARRRSFEEGISFEAAVEQLQL